MWVGLARGTDTPRGKIHSVRMQRDRNNYMCKPFDDNTPCPGPITDGNVTLRVYFIALLLHLPAGAIPVTAMTQHKLRVGTVPLWITTTWGCRG